MYDAAGHVLSEPVVTQFPLWLSTLPEGEAEFISTDFTPFQPALAGTRSRAGEHRDCAARLAAAIGAIAYGRFCAGLARDPAEIDADYIRRSDAELFWKEH